MYCTVVGKGGVIEYVIQLQRQYITAHLIQYITVHFSNSTVTETALRGRGVGTIVVDGVRAKYMENGWMDGWMGDKPSHFELFVIKCF